MERFAILRPWDRGWYQHQHPSRRSRLLHAGRTCPGTDLDTRFAVPMPENGTLRRVARQPAASRVSVREHGCETIDGV